MEKPSERAKMKDVAQAAGVSIGTVDRVLHRRGRVARETIRRVEHAAAELRFSPNPAASQLSRSTFHVFLVVLPMPEQDGGYWQLVVRGVQRALSELAPHAVETEFLYYDRFNPQSLLRLIPGLVHQQATGVVLAPAIEEPARALVEQLPPKTVVLIDGELPDDRVLATIAQDSRESGVLAGKLLDLSAGARRFLSVTVGQDDYHLQIRRQGFESYFASPAVRALQSLEHLDIRDDRAWADLERWFQREERPEGIFVTNAAAHRVVERLPRGYRPRIVGYDLISENARCLRDGAVEFILNQQPENQGYQGIYTLYRHRVLNEEVESRLRMPIDVIMRENMSYHTIGE